MEKEIREIELLKLKELVKIKTLLEYQNGLIKSEEIYNASVEEINKTFDEMLNSSEPLSEFEI